MHRRVLILAALALAATTVAVPAAPSQGAEGEWLAGDFHVHTCFSHDAYCGPEDDNTGPEEFYTLSGTIEERFFEASVRGLDFLAITDHNDVRSSSDPAFGSHGVIGVPGYENSLRGHAQMLGATKVYPKGDGSAADVNTQAAALRADGGVFQINHPADQLVDKIDDCGETGNLDWTYGYDVVPDTIEVWNIGHLLQPPVPVGNSNQDAMTYWECWLDRGHRVAATGGSDAHWLATSLAQGPGFPTTWVFAPDRSAAGVLAGLKAGRTSVGLVPPVGGSQPLLIEGDVDGDGTYESMQGDTVPPGTPLRVRAEGLDGTGLVQIRANGSTLSERAIHGPNGVHLSAPGGGWVRATLFLPDADTERTAVCDPIVGSDTTYCRNKLLLTAITSPIYVR